LTERWIWESDKGDRLSAEEAVDLIELVQIYKDTLSKLAKPITLQILEVRPFSDPFNRKQFMVGYRITDGKYTSPIAHFWIKDLRKLGKSIKEIVRHYKITLRSITKRPKKKRKKGAK